MSSIICLIIVVQYTVCFAHDTVIRYLCVCCECGEHQHELFMQDLLATSEL